MKPKHPIARWIESGENEQLDFKKTITSSQKIAKTLAAFANHKGGRLLIGINDNGSISGIRSDDDQHMIDLAASFFCKPEPIIMYTVHEWQGKQILECEIKEGEDKPYYAKNEDERWLVYIRVKDKTLLASKIVADVLKRNHQKVNTFIQYTRHEENLLKQLQSHEKLNLKEICKLLNISRWRAQKMLINLISAGIIRNHTNEKMEFYTLS